VSQIHRFHLRRGYDALAACFLVISSSGRTAPLLPQYCSSSFFHAARHRQVLTSECRRRAVKKRASQSSRTVAVRRLNWHRSAIFQRQYDFSSATWDRLFVCARNASGGEQGCPPHATGRWLAGLKGVTCSRTGAGGTSSSPPTARKRWLLTARDNFLSDIQNCSETMHFQLHDFIHDVSPNYELSRKFTKSDNFFRRTALSNRAV
jgi:hypothetical protein